MSEQDQASEFIAFALTDEYAGNVTVEEDGETVDTDTPVFQGALLASDRGDFDVAAELAKGGGVIVLELQPVNGTLIDLLDALPCLERVDAPDAPPEDKRTVPELREALAERDLPTDGKRADLLARLAAADNPDAGESAGEGHTDGSEG